MFTLDTRKQYCPIEIFYCDANPAIGHVVHMNQLYREPRWSLRPLWALAIISATQHSDYSGGSVEMSNRRVLSERARELGLFEVVGSHGYQALAYDATLGPIPASEELADIIEGLEAYGVIDEENESTLQSELELDAWDDWGRKEFRNRLQAFLDNVLFQDESHDLDKATDEQIDALWRAGCEAYGVNGGTGYQIETGGGVYFYFDDWFRCANEDGNLPSQHAAKYGTDTVLTMEELSKLCRD